MFKNLADDPIFAAGSVYLAPGQWALHPGPQGQFSIIRFTAPKAGNYRVDATFTGIDDGGTSNSGTTTDVGVHLNGGGLLTVTGMSTRTGIPSSSFPG